MSERPYSRTILYKEKTTNCAPELFHALSISSLKQILEIFLLEAYCGPESDSFPLEGARRIFLANRGMNELTLIFALSLSGEDRASILESELTSKLAVLVPCGMILHMSRLYLIHISYEYEEEIFKEQTKTKPARSST